jgi:hypothetical protein
MFKIGLTFRSQTNLDGCPNGCGLRKSNKWHKNFQEL